MILMCLSLPGASRVIVIAYVSDLSESVRMQYVLPGVSRVGIITIVIALNGSENALNFPSVSGVSREQYRNL